MYFITTSTDYFHQATEVETIYLDQVIEIDGRDAVVLDEKPATNGSGRTIGQHLTVTDEAWQFVQEAIRASEA